MTQEALFPAAQSTINAPRCRMCARPSKWNPRRSEFGAYCAGTLCTNRERLCQACGAVFTPYANGARGKYCCPQCANREPGPRARCAWCGNETSGPHRGRSWPYVCKPCLDPIKHIIDRLKAHHVPHERARQLLDDPGCEICGVDLLAKTRESSHGGYRSLLVVDHDHGCCPVDTRSCGRCVRGLICRDCNTVAGLLRDEPKHARSMADYLDRWRNRSAGLFTE